MQQFSISVIVPIYNAERTLQKCIDSILNQSFIDFELLLINDGSTDNSMNICEAYVKDDARVKAFNKINGGVSSARNLGLKNATGEWVCFIDSDDYLPGDALERLLNNDMEDLVVGGFARILSGSADFPKWMNLVVGGNDLSSFLTQNIDTILFRVPWAKLFKRNIIEKNNLSFDENLTFGEDTLFVVTYLQYTNSIRLCKSICYNYYCIDEEYILKYARHNNRILEYANKITDAYRKLNDVFKLGGARIVYGFIFDILKVNLDSGACDIDSFRRFLLNDEARMTLKRRSSLYMKMMLFIAYLPSIILLNYLKITKRLKNA